MAAYYIEKLHGDRPIISDLDFYRRFIDDLFTIGLTEDAVKNFFEAFNNVSDLKLDPDSIHIGRSIVFLDLVIYITANGRLGYYIYEKPMNAKQFISPHSNHAKHIFPSWVAQAFKRRRLLCSDDNEYVKSVISFTDSLKARGYPLHLINKARHSVPSRQVLLEQLRTNSTAKATSTSGARYKKFIISGIQVPKIRGHLSLKSLTSGPAFKQLISTKTWKNTFQSRDIILGLANPPNANKLMIRSLYAPKS
jgi:hypothetical protein